MSARLEPASGIVVTCTDTSYYPPPLLLVDESSFLDCLILNFYSFFIGFKITFSNIRSHGAPLLISRGWRLAPPPRIFDAPKYVGFNRVKLLLILGNTSIFIERTEIFKNNL